MQTSNGLSDGGICYYACFYHFNFISNLGPTAFSFSVMLGEFKQ